MGGDRTNPIARFSAKRPFMILVVDEFAVAELYDTVDSAPR